MGHGSVLDLWLWVATGVPNGVPNGETTQTVEYWIYGFGTQRSKTEIEIWEYLRLGSLENKPEAKAYGPYILLWNKILEK